VREVVLCWAGAFHVASIHGGATSAAEIDRSILSGTEGSFDTILADIVLLLYPPPNTPAQLAAKLGCSVRNVELYMSGKQKWSGDAIAFIVAEIMRRHAMRNFKVTKRGG
jgi:hypothetical protein